MGIIGGIGDMIGARRQMNTARRATDDLRSAYDNAGAVPTYGGYDHTASAYAGPGAFIDPGAYTSAGQAGAYINDLNASLGVQSPVDYRDQARSAYFGAADDVLAAAGAGGLRGGGQVGNNLRALNQAGITSGLANLEANYANQQAAYDAANRGAAMAYGQNAAQYGMQNAQNQNAYNLSSAGMQNQFNLAQDAARNAYGSSEAMRNYGSNLTAYNTPLQHAQDIYDARMGLGAIKNQSASQFAGGLGDAVNTAAQTAFTLGGVAGGQGATGPFAQFAYGMMPYMYPGAQQ